VSLSWECRIRQEARPNQNTILLAESDPIVRQALRRTLEGSNYSVLETTSGDHALDICRRHNGPIHLLLSDVGLPGLHGPELAKLVTAMRPLTRVVFLTAEPEETNSQAGVCPGCWLLVRKPFRPRVLAHVLGKLLHREPLPSGSSPILTQAGLVE
jgi:two-component system, cell cycle sensor histidine kinase and response regulator CckA